MQLFFFSVFQFFGFGFVFARTHPDSGGGSYCIV